MIQKLVFAACAALFTSAAHAGGNFSPKPPPPPQVDLSTLPDSAVVRYKGSDGKEHPIVSRLMLEGVSVPAGSTEKVSLHLTIKKDWYTYWKSPGDVGKPTEAQWTVPQGWTVGAFDFPIPQKVTSDKETSFGYQDQVLLSADISVPVETAPGTYPVTAAANWLVCDKSCIPGEAKITLPVEVTAGPDEGVAGPYAELFSHYHKQLPTPLAKVDQIESEFALSMSAIRPNEPFRAAFLIKAVDDGKIELPKKGERWPTFAPLAYADYWMLNTYTVETTKDGQVLVVLEGETFEPETLPANDTIGGLFQLKVNGKWVKTEITAPLPWAAAGAELVQSTSPVWELIGSGEASGAEQASASLAEAAPAEPAQSFLLMLLFAFLGGLLLNVMPCVIPVVVPKILSVVKTAQKADPEERRGVLWSNSLAYTAGVVATMLSLGATVVALKAAGNQVGWGFQFQNPWFLVFMITVLLVLGLGMLHVYPLKSADHKDQLKSLKKRRRKTPLVESFLTGLLVTFLGTPCTAPMLGPALGYAFTASSLEIMLFMFTVALGLSTPFLLLGAWTGWTSILPRGVTERYDKVMRGMAFLLFATAVWLLGVLASAYGSDAAINLVWFLLAVSFVAWVWGLMVTESDPWGTRLLRLAPMAVAVLLLGAWLLDFSEDAEAAGPDEVEVSAAGIRWEPFSEEHVASLQASGKTVFIDFTADWCMNCKANERLVIETAEMIALFEKLDVITVKADNTRPNAVIQTWLERHKRAGVPMYLVLPACGAPADTTLLPEILTTGILGDALEQAGPSRESCS